MAYKSPKNFIEETYDAMMTIKRDVEVLKPNGSYGERTDVIYTDKPCGVYVHRAEEFDKRRSVQPETGDFRVFCDPSLMIYKGDFLVFTQYGRTYKTICGDPIAYETHQEIVCRQESVASGAYQDGELDG